MTREIKFRIRFKKGEVETCLIMDFNSFKEKNIVKELIDLGNKMLSVEESIGLKDKNGKEIFEGDIIKNTEKDETISDYLIVWIKEDCKYMLRFWSKGIEEKKWEEGEVDILPEMEVIRNKFENPELLK